MKIQEENNDALALVQDIEDNATDVMLADIAPEPTENDIADNIAYKPAEDPEHNEDETTAIAEARRRLIARRLTEAISDNIRDFLLDEGPSGDGSFEAFANSPYYAQAVRRDGSNVNDFYYKEIVGKLLKSGKLDRSSIPANTSADRGSSPTKSAYDSSTSADNSIYKRGEDFDAESPESELLAGIEKDYADASGVISDDDIFEDMAATVKEIILGTADKRHFLCAGDPGIGKTYTCKKAAEKYAPSSGKKFSYFSGAMSSSLSSIVPFFYYHSNNEIIMLDDNDAMLQNNLDQKIQNMMKAILDPSALHKPVSVPVTMLDIFNKQLQNLSGSKQNEAARISIDTDALREHRFVCKVNGEVVCNDPISLAEANKLSNIIYKKHLTEADEDEDEEDLEDDIINDKNNDAMPSEFVFNTSVIFISNLKLKDVSSAVADRCETIDVNLTLNQYMHRLQKILGGLCKGEEYSKRPQYMRDWAKKSIYVLLQALIEGFHRGSILFGHQVVIRRKFTFRMFEEFCGIWCRYATTAAEKAGLDLTDENNQRIVSKKITGNMIIRMLDWMKEEGSRR